VKSVLIIGATLERLETSSIPVIGFGTTVFPRFWLRESAETLDWSVDTAEEVALIMRARDQFGLSQGIVLANPVPAEQAWDAEEHDRVLATALEMAAQRGISGKSVTPFLLQEIVTLSSGRSLEVNLDLARNNVSVAGDVAKAWSALG
jgi:pseudouridine-5'-phosphate glycosidase